MLNNPEAFLCWIYREYILVPVGVQERESRAVRVGQVAESHQPAVQFVVPMIETLGLAKQGFGELVLEAGLRIMLFAMAEKTEALAGARHQRSPDRQAHR